MFATAGLQELVHLQNCKKNKKPCPLTSVCFLQMDCFAASFVTLPRSFAPSPSPPTHCSMKSAGDLIEQIDCKWKRGVWVNQSNIVKQFFGHEGISLACVELIRTNSSQCWLLGPRAMASLAPWRTTHAPLSMLHCLWMPHHSPLPLLQTTIGMMD